MTKKLFIKSYGCQMNEYDSAKISDILASSHHLSLTNNPHEADLIVLNTCSVRAKASEKVFSELGRLKLIKKNNPNLIIAVGGCVSMEEKNNIFRRAPYTNIVFGPQTLHRLPNLYDQALKKEKRIMDISLPKLEKFDYLPSPSLKGPTAFLSIMEGCNKFCSYCIVPYTRGREVNRTTSSILAEVETLVAKGAREIHLLGQNVNSYYDPNTKNRLANLIHQIAEFKEVARIRFTTSHPRDFDDELIASFKEIKKLADHIHLPIQSGSDRILQLMRRSYTYQEYKFIVDKLRAARPNISISTDIIVGFPSETEEDFQKTIFAVKELNFDSSFSFIYSKRPGTKAADLPDIIKLATKKQRLMELQNLLAALAHQHAIKMVGTNQEVLVVDHAKKNHNQFFGKTSHNHTVNFCAKQNRIGELVKIKITDALSNSLLGEEDSSTIHPCF